MKEQNNEIGHSIAYTVVVFADCFYALSMVATIAGLPHLPELQKTSYFITVLIIIPVILSLIGILKNSLRHLAIVVFFSHLPQIALLVSFMFQFHRVFSVSFLLSHVALVVAFLSAGFISFSFFADESFSAAAEAEKKRAAKKKRTPKKKKRG